VTPTLTQALAWAADGAAHLRGMMTRMGDDAFAKPSSLPDWTRAHVLTHVARNADAMVNLVTWARTGVPTPAYPSRDERDADIETGAGRTPAEIRADLIASSDRLAAAVREMPEEAWSARIADTRGRRMIASDVLWLRAREVWIHAIDLDAGASFTDLPRPMLRELLTDAAATLGARPDFPRLLLVPSDESRTWTVGEVAPGSDPAGSNRGPLEVRGTAAELAAWLLGRSKGRELRTAEGKRPPKLPPWL
jgi:maleylpyruvate isomerase